MSHTPHELAEEFPDLVDRIHSLRQTNTHFDILSNKYHTVNRAVHRAETNVEPTTDDHLVEMRKERLHLKDEIYRLLMQQAS